MNIEVKNDTSHICVTKKKDDQANDTFLEFYRLKLNLLFHFDF